MLGQTRCGGDVDFVLAPKGMDRVIDVYAANDRKLGSADKYLRLPSISLGLMQFTSFAKSMSPFHPDVRIGPPVDKVSRSGSSSAACCESTCRFPC